MTEEFKKSAVGDFGIDSRIEKEAINQLPLRRYEGPIEIVKDQAGVDALLPILREAQIVGFDTESRPSFKKGENYPPSLLQFATSECCYLVQLRHLPDGLESVCSVLCDPSILKVGVALHEDIRRLHDLCCFEARGFLELGQLSKRLGIINTGLRSLTALLLGFRISKTSQVSNWNKVDLSESQIRYAATDAWASLSLYQKLSELGMTPEEADFVA